ncbi:hypothetical protein V6N13_089973 [Hibiscus sabdariffa]
MIWRSGHLANKCFSLENCFRICRKQLGIGSRWTRTHCRAKIVVPVSNLESEEDQSIEKMDCRRRCENALAVLCILMH